jgi:outer membrane protein OmpA-like peptidoglycan-associated protein
MQMSEKFGGPPEPERVQSLIAKANTVGDRSLPPPSPVKDHTLPWALFFIGIAGLVIGGLSGFVLGRQQARDEARASSAIPPVVSVSALEPAGTDDATLIANPTVPPAPSTTAPNVTTTADSVEEAPTTTEPEPTTTVPTGPTTTEPPPAFPPYLAEQVLARPNFALFDGQKIVAAGVMSTEEMTDEWNDHLEAVFDLPVVNDAVVKPGSGSAVGFVSLPGICFFEVGSSSLRPDCEALLGSIARALIADPEATVSVSGHSDSSDSVARIERYATDRANAARDALVREGVDESRITVLPRGAADPSGDNATAAGRAANRRVDVTIDNLLPS